MEYVLTIDSTASSLGDRCLTKELFSYQNSSARASLMQHHHEFQDIPLHLGGRETWSEPQISRDRQGSSLFIWKSGYCNDLRKAFKLFSLTFAKYLFSSNSCIINFRRKSWKAQRDAFGFDVRTWIEHGTNKTVSLSNHKRTGCFHTFQ